jgi:hypothetical protein
MSKRSSTNFNIVRVNAPVSFVGDLYFKLTRLPWSLLIFYSALAYLSVNIIFGWFYF